jgi:NitT/TauT family transport system permease protein
VSGALAARPRTGERARNRSPLRIVRKIVTPFAGVAVAVALWAAIVSVFDIAEYVVPTPGQVGESLVDDWSLLWRNLKPTVIECLAGFFVGAGAAIALAVVFVYSRTLERSLFPVAVFIQTIPLVAIAPILVIMFGNGYTPKIIIAGLISFFPTLVNMVRGLQAVDPSTLELFRVLSASRWEVFWKARLYASLPFLFAALKIAATTSVIGAIVAEWVGANAGLGALIIESTYNFRTPLLYATMIVSSLLALVLFAAVSLAERLIVTWETEPPR